MIRLTREELKHYDGREGRKAYFACHGKIYDVTGNRMWPGGRHLSHWAGMDLTLELADSPHGKRVFERLSPIGELID